MKRLIVPVIALFVIGFPFVWWAYQVAKDRRELPITPVAPLTLESAQPLSREAKQKFIQEHEFDVHRLTAGLLRRSLERGQPVIRAVHARKGGSKYFAAAESDAVRPVLDFVAKYSGVTFQHVEQAAPQAPFEQDTLLIRYEMVHQTYRYANGPPGTFEKEEPVVTITLLEAKQTQGDEISASGSSAGIGTEKEPYRRSVESLKRQLADLLALPWMCERSFPFDPEREARVRAVDEWSKKKKAR